MTTKGMLHVRWFFYTIVISCMYLSVLSCGWCVSHNALSVFCILLVPGQRYARLKMKLLYMCMGLLGTIKSLSFHAFLAVSSPDMPKRVIHVTTFREHYTSCLFRFLGVLAKVTQKACGHCILVKRSTDSKDKKKG